MDKKFDVMTLIGFVLGVSGIVLSYIFLSEGKLNMLIGKPALEGILIVVLGTISATIVGQSWSRFTKIFGLFGIAYNPPTYNIHDTIESLVNYDAMARKDGVLALEKELPNVREPFFKKMFNLAIDGNDPDVIRSIAESEMEFKQERHNISFSIFVKMGGYSPTMGIIGTVIALIGTFATAGTGDKDKLIQHIATAFVATLWGIFLANLVFLPISDRLRNISLEEKEYMEIVTRGVIAIQEGEAPSIVKAKLYSMLPETKQEKK